MAIMSGSAGDCPMSPTANPANPAPVVSNMSSEAVGTSLAQGLPCMSTNMAMKNAMPSASARSRNHSFWSSGIVVMAALPSLLSWNPVRAGQRNARHRRGLDVQCGEVLRLQVVDVGLPARPCERGELHDQGLQVVRHASSPDLGVETALELRVLRGDSHGTPAGLHVMTVAGGGAEPCVVLGDVDLDAVDEGRGGVAAQRHERRHPDRDRVG